MDYNRAIELDTVNYEAYYNRGLSKGMLGDFNGAISDYNKVIELNPTDKKSYYNRGFWRYKANDRTGACEDWTKAGEMGEASAQESIKNFCN